MKWLKGVAAAGILLVTAGVAIFVTKQNLASANPGQGRMNVLVVSLCSFRLNSLKHYGLEGKSVAPALDKFIAESSFVFDNMFNGVSWTSLFGFTGAVLPQEVLHKNGYLNLIGFHPDWQAFLRIPYRKTDSLTDDSIVNDNDFEKNHQELTHYMRAKILAGAGPFYLNVHYKYLHYPFIDRYNKDSGWDRYLDEKDHAQLNEYLAHPEKYFNKLPFLLLLTNDPKYAFAHPEIRKRFPKQTEEARIAVTGLLTNSKFIAEWKASSGYSEDLKLLDKVYKGNISYIDSVVAPLLDLYGDKKLQENTIVVFSPDHGELHMERDHLTHGESLYDEALRVPMAIRYPGLDGKPEIIKDQFEFSAISKLLREVVDGKATRENFRERMQALRDDVVVTRDCLDTQRGMRFDNKYKYFVRVADGERFLYNLQADPKETTNIAASKPDVVDKLEDLYWRRYPEFTQTNVYKCAPWMLVKEN